MRGGHWSDWQILTAILSAAFLLRLACAIGLQRHLDFGSKEVCLIPGDADGYWKLAKRISAGEDFSIYQPPRHVMRMPGFPFVLAVSRRIFPESLLAARIWLAVIGTAACWFTYLLGKELSARTAGLWAAAITAVSPVLSLFSVLLLSETTFAATMTASLVLLVKLFRRWESAGSARLPSLALFPDGGAKGRWSVAALSLCAGVSIAIATYMRPTWLLVAPISAAVLLLPPWTNFRQRLLAAILICVACYGTLLPWGLRNRHVTGHFTFTTFWVGPSLYDGLHPEATGDSDMKFFDDENLLGRMSEYDMDQEYRRRAKDYAWNHPGRALELMAIKLRRYSTLWPNAAQFQRPWMQAIVASSFSLILIPAVYGTWLSRRRVDVLLVTWGPMLYFAAIHMIFVGSIRYRLPAEYPFAVLSGIGLTEFFRSRRAMPCR